MTKLISQLREPPGGIFTAHELCSQAADKIEQLERDVSQAYDLRDAAESRYCTALMDIERLRNTLDYIAGLGPGCEMEMRETAKRALKSSHEPSKAETVVHADPTGKTREPPHCPSCSCGVVVQSVDSALKSSAPLTPCECLIIDKEPSAYHAEKCPRFVAGRL